MKKRKGLIIITLVLLIALGLIKLYSTYATNVGVTNNQDTYIFTLSGGSENITLSPYEKKTVIYQLKNTNNGVVKYGVGYSGSNVIVKFFDDSYDRVTGTIGYGENKFIKLLLKNNSNSNNTITLSSVIGYQNGGDLVVPSGVTLVANPFEDASIYITKLFAPNEKVVNNSITYDIDTVHSLIKDVDGNIRYYGASPDNYIYFNCETYPETNCEKWRIIGVVDGKLKIMRGSSIGSYSWDTSANTTQGNNGNGINEWSQADIMKLLNPGYNSETVGGSLYYNSGSGNCYNGQSNAYTSCDFTSTGLKNVATRNRIAETTWHTAGFDNEAIYSNQAMAFEKGNLVGNNTNDGVTRKTKWIGKVALPDVSDYGYAVNFNLCSAMINNYSSTVCVSNNWIAPIVTDNSSGNGRLLSPKSGVADLIWFVYANGNASWFGNAHVSYPMVPTLYLSLDESIASGSGTEANPYRLAS